MQIDSLHAVCALQQLPFDLEFRLRSGPCEKIRKAKADCSPAIDPPPYSLVLREPPRSNKKSSNAAPTRIEFRYGLERIQSVWEGEDLSREEKARQKRERTPKMIHFFMLMSRQGKVQPKHAS